MGGLALLMMSPVHAGDWYVEPFYGDMTVNLDFNSRHHEFIHGLRVGWKSFELEYIDQRSLGFSTIIKDNKNNIRALDIDTDSEVLMAWYKADYRWLEGGIGAGIVNDRVRSVTPTSQQTHAGHEPAFGLHGGLTAPLSRHVSLTGRAEYLYYEIDAADEYEHSPDQWTFTLGVRIQ